MKKMYFLAVCCLISSSALAQRAKSSSSFFSTEKADAPITFGVRGGVNFAGMSMGDSDIKDPDGRTSFNVGVSVDIPILQSLYVNTGLWYTSKGCKWKESDYDDDGSYEKEKLTYSPAYLQIPVLASYRFNFSDKLQWQLNFGPYFACGVGGKGKYKDEVGYDYNDFEPHVSTEKWDFFGDKGESSDGETWKIDKDDRNKRFDFGLAFGTGLTIAKHFFVGVQYELGLTRVCKSEKSKNRNFSIYGGFNF